MHAGALAHALDRLASTGRVLYVAAHPDDENTRLLSYLANERHVNVAYLSMTRGGGGQNLIGREQDALLDVIRTEELLAARRLDGALQRFTRMRDFGYSKTSSETLALWEHDEALADVVWVVRTFQPDVIITRFDERPPNHGHHTASAILAREAFAAAADPKRFPEQISLGAETWQADRLLMNVAPWREGPVSKEAISVDVGAYDPRLGLSMGELAARSRSQHKSQGFGVMGERGALVERFEPVAGTKPAKDILEGIDTKWSRLGSRGAPLDKALEEARAALVRDQPERALPALLTAHRAIEALPDVPRVQHARGELSRIIAASMGLFVRATAGRPTAVPGSEVPVKVEVVLRRPVKVTLRRVLLPGVAPLAADVALAVNEKKELSRDVPIARDARISTPYWLAEASLPARQRVLDPRLVGEPEGPPAIEAIAELSVGDRVLRLEVPVVYVWQDGVHGERVRSFLVVPPATVTPLRNAVMIPNGKKTQVALRVRAGKDDLRAEVRLNLPEGWRAEPAVVPVSLAKAAEETTVRFAVSAPPNAAPIEVEPVVEAGGNTWSYREDLIDHPHIPMQVVLQPSSMRLSPLALALPKGAVGYIPGSGDTILEDLAHVGVSVEVIDDERLLSGDLSRYSAIVAGIRAYNTRSVLRSAQPNLLAFVERGGTLVVQYNTNNRLSPLGVQVGPFPLEIGRDRVTDETAAMEPVNPKHPLLNQPNAITAADFSGWVQERGLYFASKWDAKYEPIFRVRDPSEPLLEGSTLFARHGKGRFVYTGLAFFRQLPAGVPGAYRLFANLIAGAGAASGGPGKK